MNPTYTDQPPSPANAVRIFDGEWISAVPGLATGSMTLFDDDRIKWLGQQLGGFAGKRVLELGPLEAGHAYMMERAGADVVAIEGSSRAFLKCLVVKEALGLKAKFLYGDFRPYLKTCARFDFVLASGVLYHMVEPIELLDDLARVADTVGIWTHYYDRGGSQFDSEPIIKTRNGCRIVMYRQRYKNAVKLNTFCGGNAPTSCWLTRDSLLDYLNVHWDVSIGAEDREHPAGACLLLFLRGKRHWTGERLTRSARRI